MALPQHKTCLSILRSILGPIHGGEARFAKMIGRSTSWLKKASCGQIRLADDVAFRIGYETGVCKDWLLAGDISKPPVVDFPMAVLFTKECFERNRVNIAAGRGPLFSEVSMPLEPRLKAILKAAGEKGETGLARYKLGSFLDEMESQFGFSEGTYQKESKRQDHLRQFELLFTDPDDSNGYETVDDGICPQHYMREFVPTFAREYKRLAKVVNDRLGKGGKDAMQELDLFPLLRWASDAIPLWPPANPHPLLIPKEQTAEEASPTRKPVKKRK